MRRRLCVLAEVGERPEAVERRQNLKSSSFVPKAVEASDPAANVADEALLQEFPAGAKSVFKAWMSLATCPDCFNLAICQDCVDRKQTKLALQDKAT